MEQASALGESSGYTSNLLVNALPHLQEFDTIVLEVVSPGKWA